MPNAPRIPESKIIGALRKWGGVKALAANELGTSRQNIQNQVARSETLQRIIAEIVDENLDIGEGHLIKGLREGDWDKVKFYLQHMGRTRGYGNRIEADIRLSEADIEALVTAFSGNLAGLRAFRASLDDPAAPGNPPAHSPAK